jgi:hypothetical protein
MCDSKSYPSQGYPPARPPEQGWANPTKEVIAKINVVYSRVEISIIVKYRFRVCKTNDLMLRIVLMYSDKLTSIVLI